MTPASQDMSLEAEEQNQVESLEMAVGRLIEMMARKELGCAKKTSCVLQLQ
jgi:hypothetical protein